MSLLESNSWKLSGGCEGLMGRKSQYSQTASKLFSFASRMNFRYFSPPTMKKARADDDDENPRMMKIDMEQLLEI